MTEDRGGLLREFRKGREGPFLFVFLSIVCGTGALLFPFIFPIWDFPILLSTLSLIAVAVFLAKAAGDQRKAVEYAAYEKGIERLGPDSVFFPYEEMGEIFPYAIGVYRMGSTHLAFRNDPSKPWETITPHLRGSGQIAGILTYHQKLRSERVLRMICDGKNVEFRLFAAHSLFAREVISWSDLGFLDKAKTCSVILSQNGMAVDGKTHAWENLGALHQVSAMDFKIQDCKGELILRFRRTDFVSFWVFDEVYREMHLRKCGKN